MSLLSKLKNRVRNSSRFSGCGRCGGTWNWKEPHSTWYGAEGMFPLCEECYQELTPKERVPFYEALWSSWGKSEGAEWDLIRIGIGLDIAYMIYYSTDLREDRTGLRMFAPNVDTATARGKEILRVLEDPTYQSDELRYTTETPPPAVVKWAYIREHLDKNAEKHWLVEEAKDEG